MPQRSVLRMRGSRAYTVAPALLFLLTVGCSASRDPRDAPAALALEFPRHAPAVLNAGSGFTRAADGFVPQATSPWGFAKRVDVELPGEGAEAVVFHGPRGLEVRVREVGAQGPGRLVKRAVMYPRDGGASYWTTVNGGAEEWLHLGAGYASADRPAAVWHVTGAEVRQQGAAIVIAGADGVARVRVTAPAAFAAGGRRVPAWLVAGPASSVELFVDAGGEAALVDPIWQAAGTMTQPLYDHRDATLGDGRILVAGGMDGGFPGPTAEAMAYDPSADAWADTQPMNTPRACHTATGLLDGTALVAGGLDPSGAFLSDVEIFDPATAAWAYVPDLNITRLNHATTRLADGTVFVTGGKSTNSIAADARAPGGPTGLSKMASLSCWNVGSSGGSGSGSGGGGGSTTQLTELFNPAIEAAGWLPTAWMNRSRERHTATLLADGRVLAAGGEQNGFVLDNGEVYDPTQDAWSFLGNENTMSTSREDHTATLLQDGTVLIAGGSDNFGEVVANADLFQLGQGGGSGSAGPGSWSFTAPMNFPRSHHTASLLPDGTVLVAGGTDGTSAVTSAEVYDPVQQTWTVVPSMASARSEHTATSLPNGYVLVAGGLDDTGQAIAASELYLWSLPLGYACGGDGECQSGHCSDAVCCDADCTASTCTACTAQLKGGGADGNCGPAAVGGNPHGDCADEGVATCGQTGLCDGLGACALYGAGLACDTPFCQGNFVHNADLCDGNGACAPAGTVLCDPGLCSGGACDLGCVLDTDCAPGAYCGPLSGGPGGTAFGSTGTCAPQKPAGQPAVGPDECQSGFVADGVCCDSACAGTCGACTTALKGGGADGVCGPIKAGADPDGECGNQGAASCGVDGACDGAGACELFAAGTVCVPGSCVGSSLVQPGLCDGAGTCVPGGAVSCAPAGCGNGACLGGCVTDPDCAGSSYCNAGVCAPQRPLGQPATVPDQCLSGFISDGVCCNVPCGGTCSACTSLLKGGGADGLCGPIKAGTDPDNECANQGAASCGTSGACDGSGACAFFAAGTVCGAASCQGNNLTQASLCNGSGTCLGQGSVSCSPGVCAGGTCQGGCVVDTDCVATAFCSGGKCAPKKPTGQPAVAANQCLSGSAADGVCCDVACVGTCVACTSVKKGSGADGACGPIQVGADPDHECATQAAATCGPIGACNGASACALYPAGTVCAPGGCQGTTLTPASLCDGEGTCVAGVSANCAPATCAGGTCVGGCAVDADCALGAYCNGGVCAPKKPLGQPATGPNQCLAGFVADGICCNAACVGTCTACTTAKKGGGADGTCGTIQAGTDPDSECDDLGAASCATNGACDGQGACALYAAGSVCAPASCQGTTLTQPNLCDGNGVCVVSGTTDCSPSPCLGSVCQSPCAIDADCGSTTAYCGGGTCQPKKPAGQPAGAADECLTGFVADGVCCSSACAAGPCDACTVAAGALKDGDCSPVDGAACDDGDACTQVDTCLGTVCTGTMPTSCPAPDQCHADGVCDPTSGACSTVTKPNGSACDDGNACTTDGCQAGVCKGVNLLDGTACPGGVCIAGGCVLDPVAMSTSSSGGGAANVAAAVGAGGGGPLGTTGAGGGQGGSATNGNAPRLSGAGCVAAITPAEPTGGGAPVALLLSLLTALRRRRSPRSRSQA